mmetsp:Transcript_1171/g.3153  ORF Transcript_1171/g.3153 Transcript_1171/m.3153 type:complete len:360 (-) Transcript_1171:69-1148(-)|eukprot:CAMPEP_0113575632 /NCGR_PEP_ID=MMETSP0015_2-20120614/27808_1 /TAXON_ID=2838 /ORGANISM="Odontella" /LENGTH=359 /DNA_ID=CAMNT_0000478897 /DNA_START=178 /DNA_END=1257 /DNA_ORIENTATION=+ /assembly_acc=CAM_ASM_000160
MRSTGTMDARISTLRLASLFILATATSPWTTTSAAALQPTPPSPITTPIVETVKNLRPVVSGSGAPAPLFRAASLDCLSESDARNLLDGSALEVGGAGVDSVRRRPLAAVIDLRNLDEIQKGEAERTDGARLFYSSLTRDCPSGDCNDAGPRLIHVPVLGDINGFWDEAIDRMDGPSRAAATLRTAFDGGALDRAAARNLEEGGHAMLYTVMLATAGRPLAKALDACVQESKRGPVVFHCQKGKDRTGVLSMLVQRCLGETDEEIVEAYGGSGDLLGGEDSAASIEASRNEKRKRSTTAMVDWSHFRGSPACAMADTLEWINQKHGSVDGYLDSILFNGEKRADFRGSLGATKPPIDLT